MLRKKLPSKKAYGWRSISKDCPTSLSRHLLPCDAQALLAEQVVEEDGRDLPRILAFRKPAVVEIAGIAAELGEGRFRAETHAAGGAFADYQRLERGSLASALRRTEAPAPASPAFICIHLEIVPACLAGEFLERRALGER